MQHNKKLCPAIVGMYYYVYGITSPTEISRATGWRVSSVWQILNRKYGETTTREKRENALINEAERDYLAGVSTYEMAEKYGVDHSTISKWMKKRGHHRGKGWASCHNLGKNKGHETQRSMAIERLAARALEDSGGTIELIEYRSKDNSTFLCHVCGHEFVRRHHQGKITCKYCNEKKQTITKAERERLKHERALDREREYAKEKICASCGAVFHSEYETKKYCSDTCSRREKRHRNVAAGKTKLVSYGNHRKRARIKGVDYEPGITLKKLIERDGNICQICGQPCDENDHRYGHSGPLYPSIDHIKPMAKGGSHTWDNVQLAHMMCNSIKRDIYDAEEQTA